MYFSKRQFFINHSFDSVVHVLDERYLRETKSPHVRDVVDMIITLGVLTVNSSDLHMELVCNCLEFFLFGTELWQMDVHRSSKSCTEVGWTRSDVSKVLIVREFCNGLNVSASL